MFKVCFCGIFLLTLHLCAREPIIFNAIEKSASVYIGTTIRIGLDLPLITISNQDGRPGLYIVPEQLHNCVLVEGFAREHLDPTPENIALLQNDGLKMIFHVRDLRQVAVSLAHYHFSLVSKGHQVIINNYLRKGLDVRNWILEDFYEYAIQCIPQIVERIQGWLEVYRQGTIPMLITTYEEFLDDEVEFFRKILAFYDIPLDCFKQSNVPKDCIHHFRKGSKDEWREVFPTEQKQRINSMIPDELFDFFQWER
jgi:hypothetical protein